MAKRSSQTNSKNQKIDYAGRPIGNQVELLLEDIKEKRGAVIHIAVTDRTTIELPAYFTPEQIEARIANYRKLHTSKI